MIMTLMIPFGYAKVNMNSQTSSFNKPTVDDYKQIDVNTISAWVTNYGSIFRHPITGNSGFEWPKDGGVFAIYASGLWVGAKVDGEVRVAVAEYSYEFKPGQIDNETHLPLNPDSSVYLVYKYNKGDAVDPVIPQMGGPSEVLGDQMLWCVYNDGDPSYHVNMGTGPLKVEIQQTVFGYDRLGPLGNTVFIKWLVINKSGKQLEDTYISIWSDPDLGDSGDDFVGSDTTLSLGYVYNSSNVDGEYGASPPSAGYDFLQGPIVPSPDDTAYVSGVAFPGYKNLPMTSFVYYNNSNENNGNPQTGPEVYNYMQAKWRDGTHITYGGTGTTVGNPPTNFMFTGDPESGTGWLDESPADRRFMMTTGPFTMEPFNDTNGNGRPDIGEPGVQEIVAGVVIARGLDNKNSVTLLKFYDSFVQKAYDANFEIPNPPPTPQVDVTTLSKEVVLNWDNEFNRNNVETYHEFNKELIADTTATDKYYDFEGYIVYQYDFLDMSNAKIVAIYDVKNGLSNIIDLQFDPTTGQFVPVLRVKATDSGISRWISITEDKFATGSDVSLINGKRYWFGVSAYGYNEFSLPKVIESSPNLIEVTPQAPAVGTQFHANTNDMITSTKEGESDGGCFGVVVDPSKLTGHEYKVEFIKDTTSGNIFWRLTDLDLGTTVLDSQFYQGIDSTDTNFPIADGVQWKVLGPMPGIKAIVQISNAGGPLSDEDMDDAGRPFGGNNVWHSLSAPSDANRFYISAGGGAGTLDRMARSIANAESHDFEIKFSTDTSNIYLWWYDADMYQLVPFKGYDVGIATYEDTTDDVRCLTGGYSGDDNPGAFDDFSYTDPYFGFPATDWLYLRVPVDDQGTYSVFENDVLSGAYTYAWWGHSKEVLARIIFCDFGGGGVLPEPGTVVRFITNKINGEDVTYTLQTPDAATYNSSALAKKNLDLINVFPNPYYGAHSGERTPVDKWVEFTHLPPTCTIRIFNIAGALIKTIKRQGVTDRTWEKWGLDNEAGLPVASGIYIYHIDVPGVGEKIGKMALFLPQERLDTF